MSPTLEQACERLAPPRLPILAWSSIVSMRLTRGSPAALGGFSSIFGLLSIFLFIGLPGGDVKKPRALVFPLQKSSCSILPRMFNPRSHGAWELERHRHVGVLSWSLQACCRLFLLFSFFNFHITVLLFSCYFLPLVVPALDSRRVLGILNTPSRHVSQNDGGPGGI